MALLDRYILHSFLKIFITVTFASLGLIVVYSLTDFFLSFRIRDTGILLKYLTYLVPLGFYILSPILVGISIIVLFKRVFQKRIDLTAQSFSMSPLRFSFFIISFSAFLSLLFLIFNESFLPGLFRGVWYMEKKFKNRQEIGRIVEKLWFVKNTGRGIYYVYVDNLEVGSGAFAGLYLLKTSEDGEVLEAVQGKSGRWKGHIIFVTKGSAYNFKEGYFVKELSNFSLGTEIALREVGLFAEKIEHVRSSSLITLYTKGERLGFDTNRYFSELMFRAGMSFFPFMLTVPTLWGLVRFRKLSAGAIILLVGLIIGWLIIISPKVIADKANAPPQYALAGYLVVILIILKGFKDLSRGFRV